MAAPTRRLRSAVLLLNLDPVQGHEQGGLSRRVEPFAKQSPYRLLGGPVAGYHIVDSRTCEEYPVRVPAAPQ